MPHILLVEDDLVIGESIKYRLEEEYQYQVTWIQRGDDARDILQTQTFDLLVINEGLPKVSGTALAKPTGHTEEQPRSS